MSGGSGEWETVVDRLTTEVESAREENDRERLANALKNLANAERDRPEARSQARSHFEEAIVLLRNLNKPVELAHTIRHLGLLNEYEGRLEDAERAYDESLSIHRAAADKGSQLDHANALRYPAAIKWQTGKYQEAIPLWEEALECYERAGISEGVAEAASRLALITFESGDAEVAANWHMRARSAAANSQDTATHKLVEEVGLTLEQK
jgi:tetratricopeptide (TPR) repeat protein